MDRHDPREEAPGLAAPSPGTLRRLQQLASADGLFTLIDLGAAGPAAEEVLERVAVLAATPSAVLLDPVVTAPRAITAQLLPRDVALLLGAQPGDDEPWLPAARRLAASGARLRLPYHPGLEDHAAGQREVVRRFVAVCRSADLPALVEPVLVPTPEEERTPTVFAARRPELVALSAAQLTPLGFDLLLSTFPAPGYALHEELRALEACERLDEASLTPWLLSASEVGFDEFAGQVRLASLAGASGFLAGAVLWQEGAELPGRAAREDFLTRVAVNRVRVLTALTLEHSQPWTRRFSRLTLGRSEATW